MIETRLLEYFTLCLTARRSLIPTDRMKAMQVMRSHSNSTFQGKRIFRFVDLEPKVNVTQNDPKS